MRKLKKYVPHDDFDMPKQIDQKRYTAVLIRQSDHRAGEDHIFSREAQLNLIHYAMRLRNDQIDEWVRIYDEGAGVSGQKRIDQRKELNRLYQDIKDGFVDKDGVKRTVGSLVIVHEDRLFRDEFHTNDTTFIELLAKHDVLLFVRTDHRRYDCTKSSDRNALLEKMIASRNYLDDHVLGRMNGNQEAKAMQGLFDGRNLAMGYVTKGKKKQQVILVYEPWARVIRLLYKRFKELDNFSKLCREIESMPYLFPDPTAEDFLEYTFKINMTKVPGGFKPSCAATVRYMLANPTYIGAWLYDDAIVLHDNHPAIVERELFMWSYQKITGRDLNGELLEGIEPRRLRDNSAQAVLKHILKDPKGTMYVSHPAHPEYIRETLVRDHKLAGKIYRDTTFGIRAHLIDGIFLDRIKQLAIADEHLAKHIEGSIAKLEENHTQAIVSVEDQLVQVRLEIQKTLAFLHDKILTLTPKEKSKYNETLNGLRGREAELLAVQEQSAQQSLKADFEELSDLLADIPDKLDNATMEHKQKLARLITESATIEEVSVHWLRLSVLWRGPLAERPDVCLIWRQRGRRSAEWTTEEDEYIKTNYPTGDKWTMLEALPIRTWNMIYQRALVLGANRRMYINESIPNNITVDDLQVIPNRELAIRLVGEASKRRVRHQFQAHGIWLYSAGLAELNGEVVQRNTNAKESASPFHSDSSEDRSRPGPASISR